ncbi:MAG: AAA family ATPase, partial [Planctomycetaceae bacterium]
QAERVKQLAENLPKLEEQIQQIENELAEAQAYQKSAEKRTTLTKALESQKTLGSLQADRDRLPQVSDADINLLGTLEQQAAELMSGIESGKLKVRVEAHAALELEVQAGLDDTRPETLQDGQSCELDAEGRIVLATPHWTIEVESGDGGFQAMKERYDTAASDLKLLLAKLKADDPQAAKTQHAAFHNANQAVATQQRLLDGILDGTTIDELTEAVGTDLPKPRRTLDKIITDREAQKTKQAQENQEHEKVTQQLEEWSEAYESEDALLDVLLQARGASKDLASQLQELPELPEEIEDHDAFVTSFHEQNERLTQLRQELLPQTQQERVRLEQNTPEMTLQTIDDQLTDAQAALERKRKELQAWQQISTIFNRLRSDLDSGTLDPWNASLRIYTDNLTASRYRDIDIESGHALRSGEFELPLTLLSLGTKSCLGVALRLSMAAHFLRGSRGFVVLDDPMVDLDPERQALMASTLKQFAQDQQTIVFTCHPSHAALLSDSPIMLERLD